MNLKKLLIGNQLLFGRTKEDNFTKSTGTVGVVNGDATVTGAGGADFTTEPDAGDILSIGGRRVTVLSVTDSTHLELTSPWYGPTQSGIAFYQQTDNSIDFSTKPADNAFVALGDIEDLNIDPTRDSIEIFSPSPGHYVMSDKKNKFSRLKMEFTLQDISELVLELLFSAVGPIGSGAAYSPYSAAGVIKGWFRAVQYADNDSQINTFDVWGRAEIGALKQGNEHAKAKLTLEVLANPLNSGTSALANG